MMKSAIARFLLVLGLTAPLAATAGTLVKIDRTTFGEYSYGLVAYGGKSGEMAVEIHGQPFGAPVPETAIASAAPMPGWLNARSLTTQPKPGTPRAYRVVLTFNPADSTGVRDACTTSQPAVVQPGNEKITISADYCAIDRSVSHLVANGPAVSGPDDPRFREMLGMVLASLLPATDPNMQGKGHCMVAGAC